MVKYCQSCGAKITHDASTFCRKCETKRLAAIDPRGYIEVKHVCPHCRADVENQTNKKICMRCGKPLHPRWGLMMITLLGMIVLLCFLWWVFSLYYKFF